MTATIEVPETAERERKPASQLPDPKGYRILVALPEAKQETDGGIIKPDTVREFEEVATVVGFVLKMGQDCYKDEVRFPTGPWCREGDWVIFRAFSGTRIRIHGKEFRILNDDSIEAVVEDPSGIVRA